MAVMQGNGTRVIASCMGTVVIWLARFYCIFALAMVSASAQANPTILRDKQSGKIVAATGLSSATDCLEVNDRGQIEDVSRVPGDVEGFRFVDRQRGSTHVNIGLHHLPWEQRRELTSWLIEELQVGAQVNLGLKVCGAGGRIVKLETFEVERVPVASLRISAATTPTPPASPDDGKWRYGRHPILGLSAYVTVRGESFGLSCGFNGVDMLRSDTVLVKMTPGVAASATSQYGVLIYYDRDGGGGNYPFKAVGRFVQHPENACGLFSTIRKSKRLIIAEGRQLGLQWVSDKSPSISTIEQRGVTKTIVGEKDFHLLTDKFEFPLTGSAPAIRQLLNACPAIKADLANDCGV